MHSHPPTPQIIPTLVQWSGLAWYNDPESYAGGSVATGRASHDRQVKGDDPDKKIYPGPSRWGFGVRLKPPPRKKYCYET